MKKKPKFVLGKTRKKLEKQWKETDVLIGEAEKDVRRGLDNLGSSDEGDEDVAWGAESLATDANRANELRDRLEMIEDALSDLG